MYSSGFFGELLCGNILGFVASEHRDNVADRDIAGVRNVYHAHIHAGIMMICIFSTSFRTKQKELKQPKGFP